MSTQALAVDAMLPALPRIVQELHVANPNHGQWVVTTYVAGVGLGQLFWGLASDRFGRRPVLLIGLALYVTAAALCGAAGSFSALLLWRFVHGLAAASMVLTRSVVRDLYAGRPMARVLSLTYVVFLTVPIIAPTFGALILTIAPWRAVFLVFAIFAGVVGVWAYMRLPETLHPEYRLALAPAKILAAYRAVLGNRIPLCYSLAVMLLFGALISYVSMMPQIFASVFHHATWMPTMFALCAGSMGIASLLNSRIVEHYGMRRISHFALLCYLGVTAVHLAVALMSFESVASFVVLQALSMGSFALAAPNFGALAMEPLGAVAGVGASVQGFVTTCGGALVASAIGRQFADSTVALTGGALLCGLSCLLVVLIGERGRLFHGHALGRQGDQAAPETVTTGR
ncbi:MAG: multidrug effflux MFS transporter [Gammaproteobacteria bacterium]|nr:multidrug effflux MFS transporter [Gammaproteobacteria bacterium]